MPKYLTILVIFLFMRIDGIPSLAQSQQAEASSIEVLLDTLDNLTLRENEEFLTDSYRSIQLIFEGLAAPSGEDQLFAQQILEALLDMSDSNSPAIAESYRRRSRQLIVSWVSPQDAQTSFTWLKLPRDWDPAKKYPIYVQLHGKWDVADRQTEYLAYPFTHASGSFAFEDGYQISPWGRGNQWYRGKAETDIWEAIEAIEARYDIDSSRMYICGHSMGGYGTWHIAHRSVETWAAIGLHAAAIWYNNSSEVTLEVAQKMSKTPVYFVVGTQDPNLSINEYAYDLLGEVNNENTMFTMFEGGHDYRSEDVEAMYLWLRKFTRVYVTQTEIADMMNPGFAIEVLPNPARDYVRIRVQPDASSDVRIQIYSSDGRLIDRVDPEIRTGGIMTCMWYPEGLKGIYFIRVIQGSSSVTAPVLLLP